MSNHKKKTLSVAVVILALLSLTFVIPHHRYKAAKEKYQIGMTLDEAQNLVSKPSTPNTSTKLYANGPNEQEFELDAKYFLTVEAENAVLIFNHKKRLIRISESTWYTRLPIRGWLGLGRREL